MSSEALLQPEASALREAIIYAVARDLPVGPGSGDASIRWEGQHAAFHPSSPLNGIDEIKVYWPELNDKVRRAYGLSKEMLLQELEFGDEFLKVPVGEFPDLNNVRSHYSLVRNRSSSIKQMFGFSSKGDAGSSEDDSGSPRGGGSSPTGVVLRRNSSSMSSKGGGDTPISGSPSSEIQRKMMRRSMSNNSSPHDGSPSPSSNHVGSGGVRHSPSLSFSSASRSSIKFTGSYLSFRKRVLIESVSPEYHRELTHTFDARATYLQESPKSFLPKIVAMVRVSSVSSINSAGNQNNKNTHKRKAYYVLTVLPYPTENHEHMFSMCLRGNGVEHGERIGRGPFSGSLFLGDGDFAREHELVLSTYSRAQLVAQLASDLGHLQHHGRLLFSVVLIATERDPVLGRQYKAGAALGPDDDDEAKLPLERRNTIEARHDLPRGVVGTPNTLLPAPCCSNWERPMWDYYVGVHEFTGKVSTHSWTDWFSGKVGTHEFTSRLLKFLKERVLIDGGELPPKSNGAVGEGEEDDRINRLH